VERVVLNAFVKGVDPTVAAQASATDWGESSALAGFVVWA